MDVVKIRQNHQLHLTSPPVISVKHLKLREISVKRRDVFHPSAPECTDFENVACRAYDLHMREWEW